MDFPAGLPLGAACLHVELESCKGLFEGLLSEQGRYRFRAALGVAFPHDEVADHQGHEPKTITLSPVPKGSGSGFTFLSDRAG